jgi:hypothetical protein
MRSEDTRRGLANYAMSSALLCPDGISLSLGSKKKKKKKRTANPREKKNKESPPDGTLPRSHHGPYSSPNLNACHSIQLTAGVGQSDLRL